MAILPLQLARVSNNLRTSVATGQLARTQEELLKTQNQLSTGKRINSPSDDPGAAAIAQQIRKTLEQRQAYSENLKQAGSQLSEVDSSLGDLSGLLDEAQSIASSNVGSDVTADQRKAAAQLVQNLYNQALSVANKQFNGVYLFAGDRATDAPFQEALGGVRFVGSERTLDNQFDEGTKLSFQVDGSDVFGALSSRVKGSVDLSPSITTATRLSDLRGASGDGVRLGSIQISDGGANTKTIDLSKADTVGDVITMINAAGVGAVTASIASDGVSIQLAGGASDNVSVSEVGGGTTAADLGILNTSGAGAGTALDGADVNATVTNLTTLASLNGGAGIALNGLQITNGQKSATISLTGAVTVEDMLNRINNSGTNVRAEINATGTGINILNPTQGTQLTIAENGGTTAGDLGVRSFTTASPVTELNGGKGLRLAAGAADIEVTNSNGTKFQVDLDGATTMQDVINAINTASTGASAGVTASFATSGNGLVLTDTAGGGGSVSVTSINNSFAAADLGLTNAAVGNVITGTDIDPVAASGVFSNLMKLRDALTSNDQQSITAASEGIKADYDRVVQIRGETGARVQELEARTDRLADQNIATQSLLSSVEDTDFTETIAKFQTLQTALQASMQTASKVMNLSLLDFI